MKSFAKIVDDITRCIDQLPQRVATHAVNFSKSRFVKQNWHDTSAEPWKKRSRGRRGSRARQNGATLVDSGRLKRSIRIKSVSRRHIVIGTDVPYAEAHNEGLSGSVKVKEHNRRSRKGKPHKVKAHDRRVKLPQRRFIGESQLLNKQLENLIARELKNAINK